MRLQIPLEEQAKIVGTIQASAGLGFSYLILLLLSTLIATFGLLSNSTATVIGAMIVAPLMGPILGIALSLVQGDIPAFRRSLTAELVGVLLCLVTALSIAKLLGPAQVDLTQSEIVGRTHPTLLDLAIGFAAGLAGAFATVNLRISASIAGVAIAVALVPPLCVSGLCLGSGELESGLGAFVLFLANFLTIQLAASIVFNLAGLGHWQNLRREPRLLRAFVVNLALLLGTGVFLARQLTNLVDERRAQQITRAVVKDHLDRLSGANLDDLRVRLAGGKLNVELLVRAPEEVGVGTARELQKKLRQQLGYPISLRIGTARASYVTPDGHLFLPEKAAPSDSELLEAATQKALTQALQSFPGVELTSLRPLNQTPESQQVFVLLRSPYLFDARLVARLQTEALRQLQKQRPEQTALQLTVRTSLVQDYTAEGLQNIPIELPLSPEELQRQEWERRAALALVNVTTLEVSQIHVSRDESSASPGHLTIDIQVKSTRPLTGKLVKSWRKALEAKLKTTVSLGVQVIFAQSFREDPEPTRAP